MDSERAGTGRVALVVDEDELLTLRHCVIEALEALGDDEFRIRTGAPKATADAVLTSLKAAQRHFAAGDARL
jgi:hypothetical protein